MRHHTAVQHLQAVERVRSIHGERAIGDHDVVALVRKIDKANEGIVGVKVMAIAQVICAQNIKTTAPIRLTRRVFISK